MLGVGVLVASSAATVLFGGSAHAATTTTFTDGVLSINGDAVSNSLNVGRTADGVITLNGVIVLDGQATVDNVDIIGMDGGAGNDTLRIDESNGTMPPAKLVGGVGNDQLTGGSGDDIIDGADGADSILGNAGDDIVDGGAGNDKVIGGPGDDTVDLGADADEFTFKTGEGDDVKVEGGSEKDTLRVLGSDGVDGVVASTDFNDESQAFVSLFQVPGATETMNFTGFEGLKIELGGDADVASVGDLSTVGMVVTRVSMDPPTGSDGAHDNVDVSGNFLRPNRIRVSGSPATGVTVSDLGTTSVLIAGADALTVFGGVGPDVIDASRLAAGTLDLTEFGDIGVAGDTLIGSPGNDTLRGGPGDDRYECRGGIDDVDLRAGGNDTVIC